MHLHLTALLLSIAALTPATHAARKPSNAVLLSTVKSLTFRANAQTSHRRVSAIPQLKCVGGSARGLFEPDTVRCVNSGSSYSSADVEWTCTASLPPEFKLGSTDVICEGYDGPEDEYVLKGSCGVEYRLILTEKGEQVYGKRRSSGWGSDESKETWGAAIFWLIFLSVVGWMIYAAFIRDRRQRPAANRGAGAGGGGWGGGGGGGGGDDNGHDDPPPPYTPRPKPYPTTSIPSPQAQSWRPGFWTGAATGAAASYLAGRGGAMPRQQPQPQSGWGGWGGGGRTGYGGGGGHDPGEGSSGGRRSGGGGFAGPSYSSSRHQSSGFGSTSRR